MTSIILAQKLSSVKLSKSEFRKTTMLRSQNSLEKLQAIAILKEIHKKQALDKICRLCLKPGSKAIFNEDKTFNYLSNIQDILGIDEIHENDGKPQYICGCCEEILRAAVQIKQTAENTQWRLQQELDMVSEMNLDVLQENKCNVGYFVEQGANIVREWKCRKCQKRFGNQEEFYAHEKLRTCPRKSSLQCCICEICGLELKNLQILKVHRIKHTGALRHKCSYCSYRAATKNHIKIHERCHTGTRPVTCPDCGADFQNASNLNAHRRVHRPPQFHCHLCNFSCKFKSILKNHIEAHHGSGKLHVCNICGMAFSTRSMVLRHERKIHRRPRMTASYKKPAENNSALNTE